MTPIPISFIMVRPQAFRPKAKLMSGNEQIAEYKK